MIVLRSHRACFKNFCTGSWLARQEASQEVRQLGNRAARQPKKLEVPLDGHAAWSPTMMPAAMQGVGEKTLCLPGFHQKFRGNSLFPMETSFSWNQNALMGNCFGIVQPDVLIAMKNLMSGNSTTRVVPGENKPVPKGSSRTDRAVSSPTRCHPIGSEQSQTGASDRIH